jgi:hypothetical protein
MAMRLKNGTGKVLNGCAVSFAVEQFSSTSLSKSGTTVTFATQVNATSPKTGTWVSQGVYSPTITSATYANLNGASSANRTTKTVVLNNLNIGPNDDLWLRWTVSSTSSEPLAMGIDDLTISGLVLAQTITFALNPATAKMGDPSRTLIATSDADLLVSLSSSSPNVAAVSGFNLSIVGPGTTTLTASQAGNSNFSAALPLTQILTVSQTFANVMGGVSPTSDSDNDGVMALLEYAFGGAVSQNDQDRMPVSSFTNNELSLTYLARTDDTSLSILPEVSTDLASNSGWVSSAIPKSGITVETLGTVDINGTTFERRKATVAIDSSGAKFMRIKIILNQ